MMCYSTVMHEDMEKLQRQIDDLHKENIRLRDALRDATGSDQPVIYHDCYDSFVTHAGSLWKPAADGQLEPHPYCPDCRLILLPVPSDNPTRLVCTACRFEASFSAADITWVAAEGSPA